MVYLLKMGISMAMLDKQMVYLVIGWYPTWTCWISWYFMPVTQKIHAQIHHGTWKMVSPAWHCQMSILMALSQTGVKRQIPWFIICSSYFLPMKTAISWVTFRHPHLQCMRCGIPQGCTLEHRNVRAMDGPWDNWRAKLVICISEFLTVL